MIEIGRMKLYHGDALEVLRTLPENSVHSVVTDPPYGLRFMGKRWDCDVPSVDIWAECFRVLRPGGHLLAFAGTRTQHRMAVRIEDAGFEIRDLIAWVYGSGFPKSLDVSKAIDKAAGAEREKVLVPTKPGNTRGDRGVSYAGESFSGFTDISEPATDAARQWQGWGTALKPALEPITVARKPLQGTVAGNVMGWGTGAININGCRVDSMPRSPGNKKDGRRGKEGLSRLGASMPASYANRLHSGEIDGRWPANFIHDGSDEVTQLFPYTKSGVLNCDLHNITAKSAHFKGLGTRKSGIYGGGQGNASRFFYCAKASLEDRNLGLQSVERKKTNDGRKVDADNAYQRGATLRANHHPTVKPTELMRYLCRLVTPPGGIVLDPFLGSGSTLVGASREGFDGIGIERESEYIEIARARISAAVDGRLAL